MIDLKTEKELLMMFIDDIKHFDREVILQRIDVFATVVAFNQREACSLWSGDSNMVDCKLVTRELYE